MLARLRQYNNICTKVDVGREQTREGQRRGKQFTCARERKKGRSTLTFRGFQIRVSEHTNRPGRGHGNRSRIDCSPATRGVDLRRSLRPARGLNDSAVAEFTPSRFHSLLRSPSPIRWLARRKWAERLARTYASSRANDPFEHYIISLPASAVLARYRRFWRIISSWRFSLHLSRRPRPARLPVGRCGLRPPWSLPG